MPSDRCRKGRLGARARGLALIGAVLWCGAAGRPAAAADNADDFLIVDCLLPSQVRQLGLNMTFMAPRQAIRTAAHDCALRGGEFTRGDAGGPAGLQMWLPAAQKGDPKAQTYIGEIFERGMAGTPDYAAAATWYRRAADQGFAQAQIALGALTEQGLGVPKDPLAAATLFRRAAGLPDALPGDQDARVNQLNSQLAAATASNAAQQKQIDQQSQQIKDLKRKLEGRQSDVGKDRAALQALQDKLAKAVQQQQQSGGAKAQDLNKTLADRDRELSTTKSSVDELRAKLAALQGQPADLDHLRAELSAAQAAAAARQHDADQLRAQLQSAQAGASAQDAKTQQMAAALAARDHDLGRSKADIADLQAKLEQQAAKPTADPADLDRARSDLAAAQQAMAQRQRDADQLRAQLQSAQTAQDAKSQQLSQTLADRDRALARSNEAVAQLTARLDAIEKAPPKPSADPAELKRVRADLTTAQAAMASQQQEADRLRAQLQASQAAQTGSAAREKTLTGSIETLERDVAARQATIAAKDQEIQKLKDQVASLDEAPKVRGPAAVAAQPITLPVADFGRYHALVIGIDHYTRLPPLKTPVADANAVAKVLRDDYGFDVVTLNDANRYQILDALNKFRQSLTDKDNLLIYYAGHGVLDTVNQRGNWLPVDAEPDSTANWISNIQITDILNAMAARQILVVADSCYSGTLTRDVATAIGKARSDTDRTEWYKIMISKPSRVALTSGGLEPVTDSGGAGHSLFANMFIKALEANANAVSTQELYQEIQPAVATRMGDQNMHQVPEYAPIKMAGHEAGDFVFVRPR